MSDRIDLTRGEPTTELPKFKYHPDPLETGSIEPSAKACEVCGQTRGFLYNGPIYGEQDLERVCPWCIHDGTAHERFGAEFTDAAAVGDYGAWEKVPEAIVQEVAFRTPGFYGWQQERWFTHCSDAAEFLGAMDRKKLERAGAEALAAIRRESGKEGSDWEGYLESMDGGTTAYLFRCRHCGTLGGYSDFD